MINPLPTRQVAKPTNQGSQDMALCLRQQEVESQRDSRGTTFLSYLPSLQVYLGDPQLSCNLGPVFQTPHGLFRDSPALRDILASMSSAREATVPHFQRAPLVRAGMRVPQGMLASF